MFAESGEAELETVRVVEVEAVVVVAGASVLVVVGAGVVELVVVGAELFVVLTVVAAPAAPEPPTVGVLPDVVVPAVEVVVVPVTVGELVPLTVGIEMVPAAAADVSVEPESPPQPESGSAHATIRAHQAA